MCVTLAAMTAAQAIQIGVAVVGAVATMQQASAAADRAAQQAQDSYAAAEAETKAKYAEANRKQAEAALDAMGEKSDAIRKANESLGTMRATETALSDSSLSTIFFEEGYGQALTYQRLDTNMRRELAAIESEKYGAEQAYINRTVMAKNQAENMIQESNARATGAILGAAGSGLNIYSNAQYQDKVLKGIKNAGTPGAAASASAPY